MRKFFLSFYFMALLFSLSSCAHTKTKPAVQDVCDAAKIQEMDPFAIAEAKFYSCEYALFTEFSGSRGYFLSDSQIEWLKKAEAALLAGGIVLKDPYDRKIVFAGSYFNTQNYEKAFEAYRNIGETMAAEESEWLMNNGEIKSGEVKVEEYAGKIPPGPTEITRAEDAKYLFVSYFKGAVYRYDKAHDRHAVIFSPSDEYAWVEVLQWDGRRLTMALRGRAGVFEFENAVNQLRDKSAAA